jgi:hypothetical protein
MIFFLVDLSCARLNSCFSQSEKALRKSCPNRNPFCYIHSIIFFVILYETSGDFEVMFGYEHYTLWQKYGIEIKYVIRDIELFQSKNGFLSDSQSQSFSVYWNHLERCAWLCSTIFWLCSCDQGAKVEESEGICRNYSSESLLIPNEEPCSKRRIFLINGF